MGSENFNDFLIPLKFTLDEPSKKKFDEAVGAVEKKFSAIGAAAGAAVVALGFAVREISKNLANLAYSAERVGASSEELKALGTAADRVGIGAESAKSSLSAFFAFVNFEGGASAIKQWFNIDFDPAHPLKAMLDSAVKLADEYALGGAKRQTAIVEARRAGINETLLTTPGAARRLREEMEKDEAFTGGKLNPIAEKAKRINADFEKLSQHLKTIGQLASGPLQDSFSDLLETVDGWLGKHRGSIIWFSNKAAEISNQLLMPNLKNFFKEITPNKQQKDDFLAFTKKIGDAWKFVGDTYRSFWDGSITNKINAALEWAFRPFKWLWDKLQSLWIVAGAGDGAASIAGGPGSGRGGEISLGGDESGEGARGARGARGRASGQRGAVGGGARGGHAGSGTGSPGKPNANFTAENAKALRESAARLGTTPEDLATVIGYETEGTFNPSIWGGAGGRYMGLIQFGPPERAQYGANENQTFKEQLGAVERYLKDRGFKPGMGLNDLYSTILAGKPGTNRADSGGTVNQHVERMKKATAARARMFLKSGETHAAVTPGQSIIPGQTDPHKPGFDPTSVPFHHSSRFPIGHQHFASTEHHDHRALNQNVEIKVAGGYPIHKTAHPLARTQNATLIRNTTATAS